MPNTKADRDRVSAKQKWEPAHVARKFKIPIQTVRDVMMAAGQNGKPGQSRKRIYWYLTAMDHITPEAFEKEVGFAFNKEGEPEEEIDPASGGEVL